MSSQCRPVSSTHLRAHLPTSSSRDYQLSLAEQPSQRPQDDDGQLNAANFERLLHFLGPDSYSAGRKYESIRARLITMFRARGCLFAEDFADVTFERVAHKLTSLTPQFLGDPAPYFYGVARKIHLEYLRGLKNTQLVCWPPTNIDNHVSENMLELLDKALSMIPNADRELILKYYAWDGKKKIDHRRTLADQLGIKLNVLRLRVFRIRKKLKKKLVQMDPELVRKHRTSVKPDAASQLKRRCPTSP